MQIKSFAVAALVLAGGAAALQAAGDNDKDKIQGAWQLESIKLGDKELPNPGEDAIITLKDGKLQMKGKDEGGTYSIDATKKPKHIDMEGLGGGGKLKGKMPGIYELDGDKLKIAFGMPKIEPGDDGNIKFTPPERPKSFDDKLIILTLKRTKS